MGSEKVLPLHSQLRNDIATTKDIGIWCNGNTTDSGPVIPGSNPGIPTKSIFLLERCFFVLGSFVDEPFPSRPSIFGATFSKGSYTYKKSRSAWFALGCSFYLFSASIAFIFCFTSSRSSLSFCTFRFISSTRLFPFLLAALRKPRLFS